MANYGAVWMDLLKEDITHKGIGTGTGTGTGTDTQREHREGQPQTVSA